jgi:tRNA G18 (ribose-2'-O)-methylase SpoU
MKKRPVARSDRSIPPLTSKISKAYLTGGSRGKAHDPVSDDIFIVEGVAAIREYLKHKPSAVIEIFAKEKSLKSVQEELRDFQPRIVSVSHDVERVNPSTPVWANVKHKIADWTNFVSNLKQNPDASPEVVVVLDHISDPRNLGAIVRSAAFFGVTQVIAPEKRQVLLTQAGVNTAQGGFALCDLVVVVNVSRALEELKTLDYWVLGAAMGGESVRSVRGRFKKQVIVLGSEDKGISQGVRSHCDVIVEIPGAKTAMESLNVSVAGGILLHELTGVNNRHL